MSDVHRKPNDRSAPRSALFRARDTGSRAVRGYKQETKGLEFQSHEMECFNLDTLRQWVLLRLKTGSRRRFRTEIRAHRVIGLRLQPITTSLRVVSSHGLQRMNWYIVPLNTRVAG